MSGYHESADCANCPLFDNDTATYMGDTNPQHSGYDVAIVGGLPSSSEVYSGGYLNTKPGQLLRKVFKHYAQNPITYYTPVVLCRPHSDPKNPKATPKIPVKAIAACRPRVVAQLMEATGGRESVPVVTLGNEATSSVLGRTGITALRVGPPKASKIIPNRVIPTLNPYVCFRSGDRFPDLVTDIGKAFKKFKPFVEPNYTVVYNEYDAKQWLNGAITFANIRVPDLTIDIECIIDKETSFGHPERHEMLCVGLKFNNDDVVVLAKESLTPDVWKLVSELLDITHIVAQNGKFDLNGIRPLVGKKKLSFDTMLASYVLDERGGIHGLKYMAQEYLGTPNYDEEVKKYIGPERDFSKVPEDILYKYNAFDVECTYLLKQMFQELLEEQNLTHVHDMLIDASQLIMDVEYEGIRIDTDYLHKLAEEYRWMLLQKEVEMSMIAYSVNPKGYTKGDGINLRSPLQVKKLLSDLGVDVDSTDEKHLQALIDYDGRFPPGKEQLIKGFCTKLLDYRGEEKLNSTYIEGVEKRLYKGKINTSFLLHGTVTGRLSSRNPNLQNIPRKSPIKTMYVASSPDNVILNVDYSQAELRELSWQAGDTYFRDIFNDGTVDPFEELTPVLFKGATKKSTHPDQWKEMRTMVKTYVYGLSYGRTEYGIAKGFGIDVAVARKHMQNFFSVIPDIVNWQNEIKQMVLDGEDLVTAYGRHRRYTLITNENKQDVLNEALAFIPQSTASDMCLNAAIEVNNAFQKNPQEYGGAKIINLVHDAIMVDAPRDMATAIADFVNNRMIESAQSVVGDYVKFATDWSAADNWGAIK